MPASPPTLPLSESAGSIFGGPPPAPAASMAMAGGGMLYGGPPPAAAGGGTVYGGTVYGGPGSAPPVPMRQVQGDLGIGKVLSETLSIYFANFIPFALLAALALSPLYLLQAYFTAAGSDSTMVAISALPLVLATILCPQIATAAITYGVFQQMRGRDASIGDCLSRGLSSLVPVLGLALIQGICIWHWHARLCGPWHPPGGALGGERAGRRGGAARSRWRHEPQHVSHRGYRGQIFGVLFVLGVLNVGSLLVLTMFAAKNPSLLLILSGIKDLLAVGLSATAASSCTTACAASKNRSTLTRSLRSSPERALAAFFLAGVLLVGAAAGRRSDGGGEPASSAGGARTPATSA